MKEKKQSNRVQLVKRKGVRLGNTFRHLLMEDDFIYNLVAYNKEAIYAKLEHKHERIKLLNYCKLRGNAKGNGSPRPADFRKFLRLLGYDYRVKLEVFMLDGDIEGVG